MNHTDVRIIRKDGTSKPFEECVAFVSSQIGKDFRTIEENLLKIYEFRCHIIHFYKENIDAILYSLIHKNVLLFNEFLKENFNLDLAEETHLILLPIGFRPFATPVDFLTKNSFAKGSSNAVQTFIKSIIQSTEHLADEGIEEAIVSGYKVAAINESRVKNADIIAGVTKDPENAALIINNVINATITEDETAQKVRIEEESLFTTIYTLKYGDVTKSCRAIFSDFKQDAKFNRIMGGIKGNPTFHRKRYLDTINKTGTGQDYYSNKIFAELQKHYSSANPTTQ